MRLFLQVTFTPGEAEHRQEGCGSDDVSAGTRITGPGPVCGHGGDESLMYVNSVFMFITLQGEGPKWEKARTMQAKMGKTRGHVESRITALTDILAPPVASASSSSVSETTPTPQQNTQSASTKPSTALPPQNSPHPPPQPPSYEEATLPPPSYRQTLSSDNLGAEARLPRSHTSDSVTSVTSGEAGEILFSMGEVQVRYGLLLVVL